MAQRWLDTTRHALKESSVTRRKTCIKNLTPFFKGVTLRHATARHCEPWLMERGMTIAPQTFRARTEHDERRVPLRVRQGLILANPARDIQRRKIPQARITIPTRAQFQQLVAAIRHSDGRLGSQRQAKAGADLVELLAYSGCRIAEAGALRWGDVSFQRNCLTITGGETGTKNHESRTVPMTGALHELLLRMRPDPLPQEQDPISLVKDAKKCLQTACTWLKFQRFTHHDFRHFFATTCIEAGVDIPTISKWLGHKDGGALTMKVYGPGGSLTRYPRLMAGIPAGCPACRCGPHSFHWNQRRTDSRTPLIVAQDNRRLMVQVTERGGDEIILTLNALLALTRVFAE